jgi:Holliday junction resolvase
MAKNPEAKVKAQVVAALKRAGVYYFFPVMGGYGRSGIPDIIACAQGRFIAIECKAGKNTTTPLQDFELNKIRQSGGTALVINEENMDCLALILCA